MAFVGVRELSRGISKVLTKLAKDGEPVIITNHNRPVAALVAVDQSNLEDLVLAATPEAARRRTAASEAIAAGRGTRLADIPVEDGEELAEPSTETIVAQLKPVHADVLGGEPSDDLLSYAAMIVGDVVENVVETIGAGGYVTASVVRRVEALNTDLYTRLLTHRRQAATVTVTVEDAAQQVRIINEPLMASGDFSINTYEACLAALVRFDEVAHHDMEIRPDPTS
jgi:prevent-host-death family protein